MENGRRLIIGVKGWKANNIGKGTFWPSHLWDKLMMDSETCLKGACGLGPGANRCRSTFVRAVQAGDL